MDEHLLQFIWRWGYYNADSLETHQGKKVLVLHPGQLNTHQGPDFLQARIQIDGTLWAGNVEVHLKTSEWEKHGHANDPHYRNVVLHVVYRHDRDIDANIPVVELEHRISVMLLKRYRSLMDQKGSIPCSGLLHKVSNGLWEHWRKKLIKDRLRRKGNEVESVFRRCQQNWEETTWVLLAKTMGGKNNGDLFSAVAASVSLSLLLRHRNQFHQIEALLMGQAGLLEKEFQEPYAKMLRNEYGFLKKKYGLKQVTYPVSFLRMRPVNFPTIRLAQLAMMVYSHGSLFDWLKGMPDVEEMVAKFEVTANDYWHYYYCFDDPPGKYLPKKTGRQMAESIILNTVIPLLYFYSCYHQDAARIQILNQWMLQLKFEGNELTRFWKKQMPGKLTALHSQAYIELSSQFCQQKECLRCAIGKAVLSANG